MKKINYFYFVFITLMWLGVDKLLSVLTHDHPAWLLILPAYSCWYILSAPLFYKIRKRKGVRSGFISMYCMQAQWTTFWIDFSHKELAYLCMFNPFKIHYLPLSAIHNAKVEIHYTKSKEYIHYVNCSFAISGKRNKIRVDTSGRGHVLYIETDGKRVIDRAQEFVNLLNGSEAACG